MFTIVIYANMNNNLELRNSPAYFDRKKKDVSAVMR